jgi:transcriptional regulator with XRE-family HTH domain
MDSETGPDPSRLVGERLKAARLQRGLTARGLAEAGDLSLNTISLIERNKMSPTVATLHKLATALGVPLTFFFEDGQPRQVVYQRRGERPQARSAHVLVENLGAGLQGQAMEPLLLTLEPGAGSGTDSIVHVGHEFVYCLQGTIEYQVDGQPYLLEPHDSLFFEAHLPHSWQNPREEPSQFLLILQANEGREEAARQHAQWRGGCCRRGLGPPGTTILGAFGDDGSSVGR